MFPMGEEERELSTVFPVARPYSMCRPIAGLGLPLGSPAQSRLSLLGNMLKWDDNTSSHFRDMGTY